MTDSRLRWQQLAGLLLVSALACAEASAQAIGSGVMHRQVAAGSMHTARRAPGDYVPRHQRNEQGVAPAMYQPPVPSRVPAMGQMHVAPGLAPEGLAPIPMDGAMLGGDPHMAHVDGGCADGSCGGMSGMDGGCDNCGVDACGGCCGGLWGLLSGALERSEYYSGVSAFSSPVNRGGTGSFGFEGGLNLAAPLFGGFGGLGYQAGVGGTISNFNGAGFTNDDRHQIFATAGIFRRVDWGLQTGFVVDYLKDEWYANAEFAQVRGEVAWMVPEGLEYGFMFAAGDEFEEVNGTIEASTAIPRAISESWRVNDLYAFYFRKTFCNAAQGRMFAGWSGDSDGVMGADVFLPLDDNWAVRTGFTYLIPEEGPLDGGHDEEAWNVSLQLVWFPHCGAMNKDYYRPLFNVANNGSMILDR